MLNFDRICLIPVGLRAILVSLLSFLSEKTYPGEFLRPEVILSRRYLRKCSISTAWSWSLILTEFSCFYDTYYLLPEKFQKKSVR